MALIKPTKSLQNSFEMRQSVSLRLFNTFYVDYIKCSTKYENRPEQLSGWRK